MLTRPSPEPALLVFNGDSEGRNPTIKASTIRALTSAASMSFLLVPMLFSPFTLCSGSF
jgi:hypothetical protein